MEIYSIKNINVLVNRVITSDHGNYTLLYNKYQEVNTINNKYVAIIYSGKIKFLEVGFSSYPVYKILRYLFSRTNDISINKKIIKLINYLEVMR